jgi:hypothetical protein
MVKIYGSAPRSWVGFEAQPGGEVYALGPPERAAELEGAQGRLLELTVRRGSPAGDGGLFPEVVTVLSWREIR